MLTCITWDGRYAGEKITGRLMNFRSEFSPNKSSSWKIREEFSSEEKTRILKGLLSKWKPRNSQSREFKKFHHPPHKYKNWNIITIITGARVVTPAVFERKAMYIHMYVCTYIYVRTYIQKYALAYFLAEMKRPYIYIHTYVGSCRLTNIFFH